VGGPAGSGTDVLFVFCCCSFFWGGGRCCCCWREQCWGSAGRAEDREGEKCACAPGTLLWAEQMPCPCARLAARSAVARATRLPSIFSRALKLWVGPPRCVRMRAVTQWLAPSCIPSQANCKKQITRKAESEFTALL